MEHQLKWPDDYLNIKCVIYSFYVALTYWFVPKERHDVLLLVNFLLASWYNARYDCARNVWYLNAAIALLQTSVSYALPGKNNTRWSPFSISRTSYSRGMISYFAVSSG